MPIKDKEKAKQYFKEYMAKRRKGLTNYDVKPVKPSPVLNPDANLLNLEQVKPNFVKPELSVKPINVALREPEKEIVKPCSNCPRLQSQVDNCTKRHTIPKDAEFIDLMWDGRYKKFIFHSCPDSCWTGKYCNNCDSLESQLINRINQKTYEQKY